MKFVKRKPQGNDLSANVSTLKTHLGAFLKKVKGGAEVIVLDRQQPIAKIVAFDGTEDALSQTLPSISWNELKKIITENDKKNKATELTKSSMSYLSEDRGTR